MLIKIGQRPDHGFDEPIGLLSDCHRRIEHFLRVLIAVDEQAAGGPIAPAQRSQLEGALAYFATAAPRHTADEEDSLFPRLRSSNNPAALKALDVISRLKDDHQHADAHHHAVDTLGRRWLADGRLMPADARELRERLAALHGLYARHIAVEDRELFPAADRLLSADQIRDIGREMAARRSLSAPATAGPRSRSMS